MNLQTLYNHFVNKEGTWIMTPANAQDLYAFISTRPIKKALELGTGIGCSASVIALALLNKGEKEFHIDTVEQYDKCVKLANELIPDDLKKYITVHKGEVGIQHFPEIPYQPFMNFKELPVDISQYDCIVVDGPGPFLRDGKYIEFPNGDVLKAHAEGKIKPGTFIAWDKRLQAIKLVERYYGDNFYLIKTTQNAGFNVLERKNNPVKFLDYTLEEIKKLGYFNE